MPHPLSRASNHELRYQFPNRRHSGNPRGRLVNNPPPLDEEIVYAVGESEPVERITVPTSQAVNFQIQGSTFFDSQTRSGLVFDTWLTEYYLSKNRQQRPGWWNVYGFNHKFVVRYTNLETGEEGAIPVPGDTMHEVHVRFKTECGFKAKVLEIKKDKKKRARFSDFFDYAGGYGNRRFSMWDGWEFTPERGDN